MVLLGAQDLEFGGLQLGLGDIQIALCADLALGELPGALDLLQHQIAAGNGNLDVDGRFRDRLGDAHGLLLDRGIQTRDHVALLDLRTPLRVNFDDDPLDRRANLDNHERFDHAVMHGFLCRNQRRGQGEHATKSGQSDLHRRSFHSARPVKASMSSRLSSWRRSWRRITELRRSAAA